MEKLLNQASLTVMEALQEGVHIVDREGITILYNQAMAVIEGLEAEQVLGKHLLDIFPNWTKENSTLLTVISSGVPIYNRDQSYVNFKGKQIQTVNTTLPVYEDGQLIGAVEIAKDLTHMSHMTEQIMDLQQRLFEPQKTKEGIRRYCFEELIGKSEPYMEAINIAKRAAKSSSSVLIYGDTGTGKELFAQSIHYESARKKHAFIAQNCAAIPETLLESLLFGTSKGAFTGAQDRPGLFEQASGGTLFLDEINSMPIALQAKILRVLQESYVRRIGGQKDIPIDVRIIAATNEAPNKIIESGSFRKDLYYRLNVISLKIPNLNERVSDIPILVNHFIREYNREMGKDVWMISEELLEAFRNYDWEGNIRELKNFIESAMNLIMDEHVIGKEHMPSHVLELLIKKKEYLKADDYQVSDLNAYLMDIEREILKDTLIKCHGNISKTSEKLKVSRQNLQYKIKKFGLEV